MKLLGKIPPKRIQNVDVSYYYYQCNISLEKGVKLAFFVNWLLNVKFLLAGFYCSSICMLSSKKKVMFKLYFNTAR